MMRAKCNVLLHEYFHVVQYQLRRCYRSSPDWHDAFGRAFGLTPDEFYAEFHEWRGDRANEDGG